MGRSSIVPPDSVGGRIRKRRLELGLSQRALSGPSLSFSYVSLIEADERNPSIKALRLLAPRLGVSVLWLETGADDPARELASIVLAHTSGPLIPKAKRLARIVLQERL
jgi:transcriptional regulator with XRE-family HTH domain